MDHLTNGDYGQSIVAMRQAAVKELSIGIVA
jgi:hypothetical protein